MTLPGAEGEAGLYLHVPFCSAVCPYCDFAVVVDDREARAAFVAGLKAEMALHRDAGWRFDTVYLGGGTPSALTPDQLAALLEALAETFELLPGWRLHLEANPEDVTPEAVGAWRQLGVFFLSLGVQSFDAEELRFLGRRHTPEEARRAVALATQAEIPIVSADLIFGLPDQAARTLASSLDEVVALAVPHVSGYQLTVHEGTPFARFRDRGRLRELPEHAQGDLFALTHERLAAGGLCAYEVSNFARSRAHRSPHNQKYWQHRPYLGLGPSAHSFASPRRWWNHRDLAAWRRSLAAGERPIAGHEELDREALALEALMLALRTVDGLDLDVYAARWDHDPRRDGPDVLARLQDEDLIVLEGARLRPTMRGLAVADALAVDLSPP